MQLHGGLRDQRAGAAPHAVDLRRGSIYRAGAPRRGEGCLRVTAPSTRSVPAPGGSGALTAALPGRAPSRLAAIAEPQKAAVDEASPDAELLASFKKLQNGSDIRGVATPGVPDQPVTLPASAAFFIGRAFADWLAEKVGKPVTDLRISIGRDPRLSGPVMDAALAAGMGSRGVRVARFGLCTTPAMFMSCVLPGWQYDGAIMVTASHLPFNRNGFKFATTAVRGGGLAKGDIADLLAAAARGAAGAGVNPWGDAGADVGFVMGACLAVQPGLVEEVNFLPAYCAHLRDIIIAGVQHPTSPQQPLEGWRVLVNAGNGGGGFFATQVLQPLGADVSGSVHLEPDGTFPAHPPNPEDRAAMAATVSAVLRSRADLGIVFDTDVDRSGVVDADGAVINKNRYIALMAAIALRDSPGSTVVTCSTTSNGLTRFIEEGLGGRHCRFKKGYRNVIGKGMDLNDEGVVTELMMETSGHGAMRENYFLDDGAYAAVKIVIEAVRRRLEGEGGISALLAQLAEPSEAAEFRLPIKSVEGMAAGARVLERFREFVAAGEGGATWKLEEVNHEGWRVAVDQGEGKSGWLLLRASLHDPQLVLNVESEANGGLSEMLCSLERFFETVEDAGVDTMPIYNAIAAMGHCKVY